MTNDAKLEHRLAAIMAMDVAGYSKLMQSDEAVALTALATIREATQNQIKGHRGRIANTAGDSVLAEFGSAAEAVSCAMALQQELSSRTHGADLQVRIGIHLGDVVDKGWRPIRYSGQRCCSPRKHCAGRRYRGVGGGAGCHRRKTSGVVRRPRATGPQEHRGAASSILAFTQNWRRFARCLPFRGNPPSAH